MRRALNALIVAAVLVAGAAGCDGGPFGRDYDGTVLVLVLGSDLEGATVPVAVFTLAGTDPVEIDAVDPRTEVTVAGTSYDRLRDAYPFSGGPGVADAYASATGADPLPFIALSAGVVMDMVGESGVTLALKNGVAAYRDGALYRLPAGRHTYAGPELGALLASVDYLTDADRASVENAIAEAVALAMVRDPDALASVIESDSSSTDLSAGAAGGLLDAMSGSDGTVSFTAYR